jgi:Glycine-zipper domain
MKNTAIITLSILFLLGMSSFAQAGHKHRSDRHTVYESHRTVTHYGNHGDHHGYRNHKRHNHFKGHRRSHHAYGHHQQPRRIHVEKHVYHHEAPVVTHHQSYRTYNPQPTYYPPVQSQPSYNGYRGDVVGDTLIGGAFGAAAGAAIGAAVGDPGQGAALGAAIGGFNGISRGVFGRGLLW